MSKKGDIYISIVNATTTFEPELISAIGRTLTYSVIDKSRSDRSANNTLHVDIVNRKNKIVLDFSIIDGSDLALLETYYASESQLYLTIYSTDVTSTTYTCIMFPYDKTRWILTDTGLWKNVQFIFEEV